MKKIALIFALIISSTSFASPTSQYKDSLKSFITLCNAPNSVTVSLREKTEDDTLGSLKYDTLDALHLMLEEINSGSYATINVYTYDLKAINVDSSAACAVEFNKLTKDVNLSVGGSGFNNFNVSMEQYIYIVKIEQTDYVIDLSLYYF